MTNDELKKAGPVAAENKLLPWVEYLTYCRPHGRAVVGYQLGFLLPGVGWPEDLGYVLTRKAMCHRCMRQLENKPEVGDMPLDEEATEPLQ